MNKTNSTKYPIGLVIKKLRKANKWSQEELASKIDGYDAASLSRLERGHQGIKEEKLVQLTNALNTSIIELYSSAEQIKDGINTPKAPLSTDALTTLSNTANRLKNITTTKQAKTIPLISIIQAGNWDYAQEPYESGATPEWRETTAKVSDSAFALVVEGDSMTNPNGNLSIPNGAIIIVDPEQQAENGTIVVAKLIDSQETTLKKLVIDGPNKYLMPLNPRYEPIKINGNCSIVGVVKKIEIDL